MALRRVRAPAACAVVRPAQAEDSEALAQLFAELGHPTTPEALRARLWASPPWRVVLVAERDLEVVGCAVVELTHPLHLPRPEAQLTALVTRADRQHLGIGRALVMMALAWARRSSAARLHLRSSRRRDGAHGFYRALGFEETHLAFDWVLQGT